MFEFKKSRWRLAHFPCLAFIVAWSAGLLAKQKQLKLTVCEQKRSCGIFMHNLKSVGRLRRHVTSARAPKDSWPFMTANLDGRPVATFSFSDRDFLLLPLLAVFSFVHFDFLVDARVQLLCALRCLRYVSCSRWKAYEEGGRGSAKKEKPRFSSVALLLLAAWENLFRLVTKH